MTTLPTWRYLVAMARSTPRLYLLNALLWSVSHMSPLLPGLIARAFFDTLTGHAHLSFGTSGLIALLLVVAAGRVAVALAGGFVDTVFQFMMKGLVRRNLLRHVLERPGAQALPYSLGETISRFRDDASQAGDDVDWTIDMLGSGLFAVGQPWCSCISTPA